MKGRDRGSIPRWGTGRAGVVALNALALLATAGALVAFWRTFSASFSAPYDFTAYYLASKSLALGLDPYDRQVLEQVKELSGIGGEIGPYLYPPFFALVLFPLTLLEHSAARWAWAMLGLLFFMASLWLMFRALPLAVPRRYLGPALAWAVLFPPLFDDLLKGQVSLLLLLLLSASYYLFSKGWKVGAGLALGLAALVKLSPLLLGLYFLLRREFRVVAAAGLLLAGLTAASLPLAGPARYWAYWAEVVPSIALQYAVPANASVVGFFTRLLTANPFGQPLAHAPEVAGLLILLTGGSIAGATAWRWAAAGPPEKERQALEYSLGITAMLLLSPSAQTYTLVLMLFPFFAFLGWLSRGDSWDWRAFDGLLVAYLLLSVPPVIRLVPPVEDALTAWGLALPLEAGGASGWGLALASANFLGLLAYFVLNQRALAQGASASWVDGCVRIILGRRRGR